MIPKEQYNSIMYNILVIIYNLTIDTSKQFMAVSNLIWLDPL